MYPYNASKTDFLNSLSELHELARDGFPGLTLGDLLQLSDNLAPVSADLLSQKQYDKNGFTLLEVTCQALSTAVVLGGRIASKKQLELLLVSLKKFERLLNQLLRLSTIPTETKKTLSEYIGHAEHRINVTTSALERTREMFEMELIDPETDDFAISGSDSDSGSISSIPR
jgi:hypothetical protein